MAALTSSGVTVNATWFDGAHVGSKRKVVDVTLVLVAQGGLTNYIAASLFGMTTIVESSMFRDPDSTIAPSRPSYDGTKLCFYDSEGKVLPIDQTVTVRGLVKGN